ncbi:MAG: DUF4340 domain-containing protein [Elusimicrobia bacterium]|nr:DUF4340 domain-containing protein [Elusimicrobiota bacterium]
MTPKRLAFFALLPAMLAGASALLFRLQSPAEPTRPLGALRAADLTRIELDYDGAHVALERAAGSWRLTAPVQDDADDGAADGLAQSLRGLALGSEVSREPSGYADYEVNESSAARVRVYCRTSAAPVLDGYFGKTAVGESVYFRPSREAAVYLAEGVKPRALRQSAEDLRSKAVSSVSVGDLKSLKFAGPDSFSLASSSGSWLAAGRKLSADQAAELVLAATSLRFIAFAPADTPAGQAGFAKPAVDLTAGGAGRSERVLIGREEAGRRYAKAERGTVGFVSKAEADSLLKLLKRK